MSVKNHSDNLNFPVVGSSEIGGFFKFFFRIVCWLVWGNIPALSYLFSPAKWTPSETLIFHIPDKSPWIAAEAMGTETHPALHTCRYFRKLSARNKTRDLSHSLSGLQTPWARLNPVSRDHFLPLGMQSSGVISPRSGSQRCRTAWEEGRQALLWDWFPDHFSSEMQLCNSWVPLVCSSKGDFWMHCSYLSIAAAFPGDALVSGTADTAFLLSFPQSLAAFPAGCGPSHHLWNSSPLGISSAEPSSHFEPKSE